MIGREADVAERKDIILKVTDLRDNIIKPAQATTADSSLELDRIF